MIHRHHRKRRSQGGDDSPANVIEIPDALHDWIHANPSEATALGLLVPSYGDPAEVTITIPEDIVQVKKPRAKREKQPEKPRNREVVAVRVPKDEREDGAGLLDERIERGRELLCEPMGWEDDVPAYNVIIAVMDKGLEAILDELRLEAQGEAL